MTELPINRTTSAVLASLAPSARRYEVVKDWSLLRGGYETTYRLRLWGPCIGGYVDCAGQRSGMYYGPDAEANAHAHGVEFVASGTLPAFQKKEAA